MKRETLLAQSRQVSSKGHIKELRRAGQVPAVLYGRGGQSLPLTVATTNLVAAMSTPAGLNVILNIQINNDEPQIAMIKGLSRDILKTGVFTHVDFVRVSMQDKIEVTVPVVLTGEEQRVRDNGIVQQPLREVLIRSIPGSIPENVPIDISTLVIGDSITVGDIKFPEGFEIVTDLGEMLVSIVASRVPQDETETKTDTEPVEEQEQ